MKYLVTGKEMKLLDQNTSSHFKVPELVLMEQAAMHFVWKLCDILSESKKERGIVFCGLGNNGLRKRTMQFKVWTDCPIGSSGKITS